MQFLFLLLACFVLCSNTEASLTHEYSLASNNGPISPLFQTFPDLAKQNERSKRYIGLADLLAIVGLEDLLEDPVLDKILHNLNFVVSVIKIE